jgi:tRNA-uridine 2-sulfurtransferase
VNQLPPKTGKVVVAMSGGVDSSVVAAYLVELGYDVIGITLQLYDIGQALAKKGACCAGQDIEDARKVAEKIGIPHYVLNYESLFKDAVIDNFADTYLKGHTPVPCIRCNQTVKFRDLLKVAKDLGAVALATGHYVQKIDGNMMRGIDSSKDQSYFLFATTREQLDYVYFPLGNQTKAETRELARKYGIHNSEKPDSQDICFVPDGNYARLVAKLRPESLQEGELIDTSGKVLGKHNGIIGFTRGQRKGINIGGAEKPLYVIDILPATNQVVVGSEEDLYQAEFEVAELNWLGGDKTDVMVKLRSAHIGSPAKIVSRTATGAKVKLADKQRAITPGQAAVFYDGDIMLGGGFIV